MNYLRSVAVALLVAFAFSYNAFALDTGEFKSPPPNDRPWVYWFWKNGNISCEGITADLKAMQRVGIGGVIMMEVSLSVPPGPVTFFSPEWRGLFKFAVEEAHRLGLSISVNSAPGWTGSGGPWVTPEQSMQQVVASETQVTGPAQFDAVLPQPETVQGFYRDIAVLAFPTPAESFSISDIREKALYERGPISSKPGVRPYFEFPAELTEPPSGAVTNRTAIVDISTNMDAEGKLTWKVPEGNWTLLRFGHTSTGQTNRPAPLPGLECDKMDTSALDAHFKQYIDTLLQEIGPEAAQAIVAVHLDSWEVGAQNWTPLFREAFQKRRGYDLLSFLPVMTGRVVDSLEVSERFLWDLRQTVSEMIAENHGRRLQQLAKERGLWFSVEPYDMTPCDDMTLGATGDVPMCEFWSKGFDSRYSVTEATSVAHVYGRPIVAAEAFTSVDRWLFHPATLKAQGDWAYSQGINRFVIHRYIHQPFPQARPGLSLGPHGLHYERTQTWWEYSKPWHEYLARCQHVLRQGRWVSDILYLSPEGAPNVFQAPDPVPAGFKFDACTPEALLGELAVKDGEITLAGGARYRLLVLPDAPRMTPRVIEKIQTLATHGAAILGLPPLKSPSLADYPNCDEATMKSGRAVWAEGKGRIVSAIYPPKAPQDDSAALLEDVRWIWHGDSSTDATALGKRYFRTTFFLESPAQLAEAKAYLTADNTFSLSINGIGVLNGDNFHVLYATDVLGLLCAGENMIAVTAENGGEQPNPAGLIGAVLLNFKDGRRKVIATDSGWKSILEPPRNWTQRITSGDWKPAIELGAYGTAPWGQVEQTRQRISPYPDSRQVEAFLKDLQVSPDFEADQPLRFAHRTGDGEIYFVSNGAPEAVDATCIFRVSSGVPERWHPETGEVRQLSAGSPTADGRTTLSLHFEPNESYFVVFQSTSTAPPAPAFKKPTPALEIAGPWTVTFDSRLGGPENPVQFTTLEDWTSRTEDGIRFYAGPAVYECTFDIAGELLANAKSLFLDLGSVEILASVVLNDQPLGIAWKSPFRLDATAALRAGENTLRITVVNLWPNRMIGDDNLPPDSERNANGTLANWPEWLLQGKPSPTGRYTFATWKHWTKEDPLLPSGLLGPVAILREK